MRFPLTLLATLAGGAFALGQSPPRYPTQRWSVEMRRADNSPYVFPYTGGLNNPQFSSADLDGDGVRDLFVLDRTGGQMLAFRQGGGVDNLSYTYAPALLAHFPTDVDRWALLRDYNCDGVEDLFCFMVNYQVGDVGIRVYKGQRGSDQLLSFSLEKSVLKTTVPNSGIETITVSNIDLPAVDDIDMDGDLDVLTFNPIGGYIEWFSNQSQEQGHGCDSLLFAQKDDCWGRVYESGLSEQMGISPSVDSCYERANWNPLRSSGVHAGSTLLTIDMDGDQDKDLMLGDLAFSNFTLLTNAYNKDTAWINHQEVFFPANTTPVDIDIFPAGFWVDVNNDGLKDLLVSPNGESNSINEQVVWYYKNIQTNTQPVFQLAQDHFLSDEMIDLGSNSIPVWVDYDQDGLTDLVVGNYGIYQGVGNYRSSLVWYKNIGTTTAPVFRVAHSDVGGLESANIRRLAPAFGDLNNDGDLDMIVGQDDGTLLYLENKGTATVPSYPMIRPNYEMIDVGLSSAPMLADLDADGDLDLVVGERNGNFNYFPNSGTPTVADFSNVPTSTTFGLIDTKTPGVFEGNAMGSLAFYQGKWQLYVGNTKGEVWHYDSIENNLQGGFRAFMDGAWDIDEGDYTAPAVADIDGDGFLDIAVGNRRGGISLWRYDTTHTVSVEVLASPDKESLIYPNPTPTSFNVRLPAADGGQIAQVVILDALGRQHLRQSVVITTDGGSTAPITVSALTAGIYFVQIYTADRHYTHKLKIE